jgi:hypothetical protein
MADGIVSEKDEPVDGDWCLVDLGDEVCEQATKVAHALGMGFYSFMKLALQEKLDRMQSFHDMPELNDVQWEPLLK